MPKVLFVLIFGSLLLAPNLAVSDCMDLSGYTSFYVQNDGSILFYTQNTPIAKVVLQNCTVSPSSSIRLLKNYVCDSDSLVVDGQECAIMTLDSAAAGSLQ
jgi:hypothetical protein